MRIAVIGGGPGGLFFSYLWKKRHGDHQVELFEQNPSAATWGFGLLFSEQALEFLRADDPNTVDAITGSFKPGTAYTAVAPCNANSAPAVCPAPPSYPINSLGTINLKTGAVGQVALTGVVAPKGLIFLP